MSSSFSQISFKTEGPDPLKHHYLVTINHTTTTTWHLTFLFTPFISYSTFSFSFLKGTSKQLGTIIEGESLLNDGAAIVLFNIFYNLSFKEMTREFSFLAISVIFLYRNLLREPTFSLHGYIENFFLSSLWSGFV